MWIGIQTLTCLIRLNLCFCFRYVANFHHFICVFQENSCHPEVKVCTSGLITDTMNWKRFVRCRILIEFWFDCSDCVRLKSGSRRSDLFPFVLLWKQCERSFSVSILLHFRLLLHCDLWGEVINQVFVTQLQQLYQWLISLINLYLKTVLQE